MNVRRSTLLANSVWNAVGTWAPAMLAIPAMGILARRLGVERFGLVTLAWALFGYFAIMDLGIARSVCWIVARDPADEVAHRTVLGTSVKAGLLFSVALAAAAYAFSPALVGLVNVTAAARDDALAGARVMMLVLPMLVATTILQAFLEGLQQFREVSLQRAITGVVMAVAPVVATVAAPTFTRAVWGLVIARAVGLALAYARVRAITRARLARFDPATFLTLFRYGGWIALSNFIYPLMGNLDRFWLSNRVGAGQVAVYSAPAELVARAISMPVAIARAVFPTLAAANQAVADRAHASRRASRLVLLSSGPVALVFLVASAPLMRLWLGEELGQSAAPVLRILAVGFVLNSLAQIPFAALQAGGSSRTTAAVHAFELGPYLALLLVLGPMFGAVGVAWAWTIRTGLDYLALNWFANRAYPK